MMPFETQLFLQTAIAVLMLAFFGLIFPYGKIYFLSEKHGGCIDPTAKPAWLFTPIPYRIVRAIWLVALVCMILQVKSVIPSLINLVCCYIYFIWLRWKTLQRGMGAPGFISFWLAALIFLLNYATFHGDSSGHLRDLVILAFKVDMAVMMIDTGINKVFHGYRTNEGMNYGMVNPAWGYWSSFWKKFKPDHFLFQLNNHSAYFFQIVGGTMMLIPATQWIGAFIIAGSFLYVKSQIRLGILCDQVMLMTVVFTVPNGWLHSLTQDFFSASPIVMYGQAEAPALINQVVSLILWTYIILLPICKLCLYYNFYGQKRLPEVLQWALERFTNAFGIILWRVFTFELIEYYMLVFAENKKTKERRKITRYGAWSWTEDNRFTWVGESIASVITFNSLRYFGQTDEFNRRVIRYAKTMKPSADEVIVFQHVTILPGETCYEDHPAREFYVDIQEQTVKQVVIDQEVPVYRKRKDSPVRVSAKPGSYAPAK